MSLFLSSGAFLANPPAGALPTRPAPSSVTAPFVCVYDSTNGRVLYERNSPSLVRNPGVHDPIGHGGRVSDFPASCVKLMTALLIAEAKAEVLDTETVTWLTQDDLESYASQVGFTNGDVVTWRDVLAGILLPSGGDACQLAARVIGNELAGTDITLASGRTRFVQEMNARAALLGMTRTTFFNAHGSDPNRSTARDLAILVTAACRNAIVREAMNDTPYDIMVTGTNARTINISNTHPFIGQDGIIGGKTGTWTWPAYEVASYNLTTLATTTSNLEVAIVIMGAQSQAARDADTSALMTALQTDFGLTIGEQGEPGDPDIQPPQLIQSFRQLYPSGTPNGERIFTLSPAAQAGDMLVAEIGWSQRTTEPEYTSPTTGRTWADDPRVLSWSSYSSVQNWLVEVVEVKLTPAMIAAGQVDFSQPPYTIGGLVQGVVLRYPRPGTPLAMEVNNTGYQSSGGTFNMPRSRNYRSFYGSVTHQYWPSNYDAPWPTGALADAEQLFPLQRKGLLDHHIGGTGTAFWDDLFEPGEPGALVSPWGFALAMTRMFRVKTDRKFAVKSRTSYNRNEGVTTQTFPFVRGFEGDLGVLIIMHRSPVASVTPGWKLRYCRQGANYDQWLSVYTKVLVGEDFDNPVEFSTAGASSRLQSLLMSVGSEDLSAVDILEARRDTDFGTETFHAFPGMTNPEGDMVIAVADIVSHATSGTRVWSIRSGDNPSGDYGPRWEQLNNTTDDNDNRLNVYTSQEPGALTASINRQSTPQTSTGLSMLRIGPVEGRTPLGDEALQVGAHKHWRLAIQENVNDGFYTVVGELVFRAEPGGPQLAVGGTPTASSGTTGSSPASAAFDGVLNNTTVADGTYWSTDQIEHTYCWLAYEFPSPVSVRQISIGCTRNPNRMPYIFSLQCSDDGVNWETVANYNAPLAGWTLGQYRHFDVPATFVPAGTHTGEDSGEPEFSPADIPDLVTWYDAADTDTVTLVSGRVSAWAEKSGNGAALTQATAAARPEFQTSPYPAVILNGSSYYMAENSSPLLNQPMTIFIVTNTGGQVGGVMLDSADATNRHAMGTLDGTTSDWGFWSGDTDAPRWRATNGPAPRAVYSGVLRDLNSLAFVNGVQTDAGRSGTLKSKGLTLGCRYNQVRFMAGNVSEIIRYNRVLSTEERQAVENYLMAKWGL